LAVWTVALLVAVTVTGALAQPDAAVPQPARAISPEQIVGPPAGKPLAGAELDKRTQELASIMRCPVCQALSVADSPTASAIAMREEARELLAAGYTEEQVLEFFEKAYGEFILLEPKKKGLNLLVWVAPILFLLGGAVLVAMRVKRGAPEEQASAAREADGLAEYAERVRREVGS
jgi:cytochrome c-type biogenesis protein CcmH